MSGEVEPPLHLAFLEARRITGAAAILIMRRIEAGEVILTASPEVLSRHPDPVRVPGLPPPGRVAPVEAAPAAVCTAIAATVTHAAVIETTALGGDCFALFYWISEPDILPERLVSICDDLAREGRSWAEPAWRGSGVDALGEILDDLPVALVLLDETGGDLTANAAARALFKLPSARAPLSAAFDRFRAAGLEGEAGTGGGRDDLQIDGRLYAMSILPLGRMGRPGVLWAFFDVTARRAAEHGRAQAKRDALLAQVAGGVGHEFNNLLARIICLAEAIQTPAADPAAGAIAEAVIEAAEGGAEMVRRLMTYAGSAVSDTEPVALTPLLAKWRLAGDMRPDRVVEGADGDVLADPDLLAAVFDELAENARRAGASRLVIRNVPQADPQSLVLDVEDNGPGMTADVLARATDPFFTTAPVGQGSGLGLSMIRGAMTRFGGGFALGSPLGGGVTATLRFRRPSCADQQTGGTA